MRRYFRIEERLGLYKSYDEAQKQCQYWERDFILVACPVHEWAYTTPNGKCLACEQRGLTASAGVVE
jgi:nitrite reductase/ring-hydroxylating ferredoxin subunit